MHGAGVLQIARVLKILIYREYDKVFRNSGEFKVFERHLRRVLHIIQYDTVFVQLNVTIILRTTLSRNIIGFPVLPVSINYDGINLPRFHSRRVTGVIAGLQFCKRRDSIKTYELCVFGARIAPFIANSQ